MKRRITSAALALCLMLTLLPIPALAAETDPPSGTWGKNNWTYDAGTCTLTVSGSDPIEKADPEPAFPYDVKKAVITDGIPSVGGGAFTDWSLQADIEFNGPVSIDSGAFSRCFNLGDIVFREDVDTIKSNAFSEYCGLGNIVFCRDVNTIEDGAFFDSDIISVTFQGQVGTIGKDVFRDSVYLTEAVFHGGVGKISDGAFCGCTKLRNFSVPDGATEIGSKAFSDCDVLTAVYIPASVTSIGYQAFENSGLRDIYYGGTEAQWKALNVPASDGSPVLHYSAAGLPDNTAGDGQTLQDLIDAGKGSGVVELRLTQDIVLTTSLHIPEGPTEFRLDLMGYHISSDVSPVILVDGTLFMKDSTVSLPPLVQSDDTVSYPFGGIRASGQDADAVHVQKGGSFTLRSGAITANGHAVTVNAAASASTQGGYVEAGKSAVLVKGQGARADISYTVLLGRGDAVISGSEDPGDGGTTIHLNESTLLSKNSTSGRLPCGIYHPQNGSLTVSSGRIYAQGGVGIVMRGGQVLIMNQTPEFILDGSGGSKTGIVGTSDVKLTAGSSIVLDQKSGLYDNKNLALELDKSLSDSLKPAIIPADGFEVRSKDSPSDPTGNTLYYYFGQPNIYTITFNNPYGPDTTLTTNSDAKIETWPTVRGPNPNMVFKGWSLTSDPSAPEIIGEDYTFTQDTELFAVWAEKGTFLVTFKHLNKDKEYVFTTKITDTDGRVPASEWPDTKVDGYTFNGWFSAETGGTELMSDYAVSKDTTIYGRWTLNTPTPPEERYTITFDLNGGEGSVPPKAAGTDGKLITLPEEPVRTGYTFDGWFTEPSGGEQITTDTVFTKDTTVYAHWTSSGENPPITEKGFTIVFNPNGGGDIFTRRTGEDGRLSALPDAPTRTGYTFDGWFTKSTGGEEVTTATVFTQSSAVYAHWTRNGGTEESKVYTITFDLNGGGDSLTRKTGEDGKLSALPDSPERTGYTFDGWFTGKSAGDKISASTVFEKDTTVYAHWTSSGETPPVTETAFTVTFDPNGGGGDSTTRKTGEDGKLSALPDAPTRTGYTFDGWFTEKSGGDKISTSTVFEKDTTVYARWTEQSTTPSTPDSSRYQIYTPGRTPGGSFYISHSSAAEGTRVTIELNPRSGYELDWLSVTDRNTGRDVSLTRDSGDVYTFLMPAADVDVEISFADTYPTVSGYTAAPAVQPQAAPKSAAKWTYTSGRITHSTDGIVPSGTPLTRDMLISVLYNMDGGSSGEPTFWAINNAIVPNIYASVLWGVDKPLTREQAAVILYSYARHVGCNVSQQVNLTRYADYGQVRPATRSAMAWAQAAGIITAPLPNILSPQSTLTCEQANDILARFLVNAMGRTRLSRR